MFVLVGDLLRDAIVPPRQSAALYRALARASSQMCVHVPLVGLPVHGHQVVGLLLPVRTTKAGSRDPCHRNRPRPGGGYTPA
ncbi:hypothetical protein AB0L10_21840 [Streptomyces flaveolus]|uniref:hypothetical protein n=1 Tax=Streptomyces flaveolus TaxID=67297 RepID=UPI0034477FC7